MLLIRHLPAGILKRLNWQTGEPKTPAGSAAGNETRRLAFPLDQKWRNGGSARKIRNVVAKKLQVTTIVIH